MISDERGIRKQVAFMAAAIWIAVGTGNMCRFIRVAAEWGGGSFLIALVLANLVWAIATLLTTPFLGSESRLGTIGAFRDFRAGTREYAA